ncbi:MBL fold metallo-hydrolase [Mesorhizobium sp. M2A.F.Ca.ET.037.01.1.1]|uniref:N-acyl homoserine lactonase family protein n=1 Tax=unclassified Mesorhizobium TaxID=325217 RepID=UPI000F761525|nr:MULTISPECIES: N-acyl homoserine lactonase family protein [unclassified Mesorhizobium]RUY06585.1 MBL fold metallo-hydrolase [Mesorhizobium sp. M2A.F.Ca.ET.040.01.1.1]AZO16082.1 N-acyl homoserine lactonase family protein [Mesorhizobium sp. M2A.F.Ca.ET.043.05.1.1]RUX22436.1 MBL fold metallo-hydrolase [Mesorhizobium sp. M2A.F.Ca.ET.037.01.1.1]RWA89249.1 MAG: MBL fold metallo-hydrolase [Mesorhizobium sp.]TIV14926.1 MAG: N-acyl homoserine lactonase family protein [Mesorhizobium sp.]
MTDLAYGSIGEMRIYPLYCGGDMTDWAVFDPFDPRAGQKVFNPYFVYVITHPEGNVLFDSGAHPTLRTDPHSRLGAAADSFQVVMTEEDWLVPRLASIGMSTSDISHVVQSHLHFDHAGGLEWLTHAKVYVQRDELAFARNPPRYQREIFVQKDLNHPIDWIELDGEFDLFGDGLLRIFPTPGHTKGHQSLLVHLRSRPVFLLGDAAYLVSKMRERLVPAVAWSPDAFMSTWDLVEEIERSQNALLVATHELDYETSVPMAPARWYA